MKISLSWLNDYIDVKGYFEKPEALASVLTAAGLEVEDISNRAKDFQNVVTGHILEKGQHPGADRLTVCQVSTGGGKVHQIVCGAKNHKQGDRVVVALPGAILPGDFAIKKSAIRGVESAGMLCSEKELGLSEEAEGIVILPPEAPIGVAFADYKGLNDILFELKVTPNRADCLSHFGLARELAALLGAEYHLPFQPFTESSSSTKKEIQLSLEEPELCPRYAGRYIKGVKVGPSPAWLKTRLESVGVKSINNVVDVTNYVMMELGQPLHAFDVRQLKGKKIIIAKAKAGESFTTLDKTEIKLKGNELTIRDGERAVALAGVVGGINSGVQDDTTDLFIESAYFSPSTVRRTSRQFGIETDSSYRFARGVNPEAVLLALNRACELIQKVAGGTIHSDPHDAYPKPVTRKEISIDVGLVTQRLGYAVSEKEFTEKMESIECEVKKSGSTLKVLPPLYRWDLSIAMDLVEEYARLNGYDKIPESLPALNYSPLSDEAELLGLDRVNEVLRQQGFQQGLNFAFTSLALETKYLGDLKKLSFLKVGESVPLMNPLSEDLNVMRRTLTVGLINSISHNYRYGANVGRLFETGYVFGKAGESVVEKGRYLESARLGLAAWGNPETLWQKSSAPLVFEIKARIEELFRGLRAGPIRWDELKTPPEFLHPGQCTGIALRGQVIGYLGVLHPALKENLKIRVDCVLAELDLDKVFEAMKVAYKVSTPSKFPAVERDLAFVVPEAVSVANIMAEIKKAAGPVLTDVGVFDVFPLEEGKRSIAFRMLLQDTAGTLNDEALSGLQSKVISTVSQKLGLSIRS